MNGKRVCDMEWVQFMCDPDDKVNFKLICEAKKMWQAQTLKIQIKYRIEMNNTNTYKY